MPLPYDKLLLNRGGGIIDVAQQAEQGDCITPVVTNP